MARVAASHRGNKKTSSRISRRPVQDEQKTQSSNIRLGSFSRQRTSNIASSLNTPGSPNLELSIPAYTKLIDERERHSHGSISVPNSSMWEQGGERLENNEKGTASQCTRSPGMNIRVLRLCSKIEQLSTELDETRSRLRVLHQQLEKDREVIQARVECIVSVLRDIHRLLEVTANGVQRQLQRRQPTTLIGRDK